MDYRNDIALAVDLDDTLYDERDYFNACIANVALQLASRTDIDYEVLRQTMLADGNPYENLLRGYPSIQLSLQTFLDIYRSTIPTRLPLRPDALRFLDVLREKHPSMPLYIITDGRRHAQVAKIKALGLDRYFDDSHVLISENLGFDKNTPVPFVEAMKRENRWPGWIYIADNPAKDFRWPRQLGWHTVMVVDRGRNIHPQPDVADIDAAYRPNDNIDSFDILTRTITDNKQPDNIFDPCLPR